MQRKITLERKVKIMKEISKKEIEKAIKEEYRMARKFVSGHYGRYYTMMLDLESGEIWSDVFLDEGSFKVYHDENIVSLQYYPGYIYETEAGYVEDAVKKLEEAGWVLK